MTFEEARAQLPVLERLAYLNAGTNGPLARSTVDAVRERVERDAREGRSGLGWIEDVLALREEARRGFAAVLGVEPSLVALTDSTTRGCQIVLAGLGLASERRGRDDRPGALRADRARCTRAARGSSLAEADEDAILAAVTPRTRLSPSRTSSGRPAAGSTSRACARPTGRAAARGRRPVRGRDRDRRGGLRLLHGLGAEVAVRARADRRARTCATRRASGSRSRATSRRPATSRRAPSSPKDGALRFDAGWIGTLDARGARRRARDASRVALRARRRGGRALPRAARAARGRRDRRPATRRSSRSARRATPRSSSRASRSSGVVVRELPGRNLVRASCGWWTSDGDLERLTAGVAGA